MAAINPINDILNILSDSFRDTRPFERWINESKYFQEIQDSLVDGVIMASDSATGKQRVIWINYTGKSVIIKGTSKEQDTDNYCQFEREFSGKMVENIKGDLAIIDALDANTVMPMGGTFQPYIYIIIRFKKGKIIYKYCFNTPDFMEGSAITSIMTLEIKWWDELNAKPTPTVLLKASLEEKRETTSITSRKIVVNVSEWEDGCKANSFIQYVMEKTGNRLHESKAFVDSIMNGNKPFLKFDSKELANDFIEGARNYGYVLEIGTEV